MPTRTFPLVLCRWQATCERLRTTDKSITAIAFECGFWDSNYFSRRFHQQLGMTPRDFRNRAEITA